MQTIRWYPALVVGLLALPIASGSQGPQPKVREIAAFPGLEIFWWNAARMPNGRILLFGVGDSITAYDAATKRATLVARGHANRLAISAKGDRLAYQRMDENENAIRIWSVPIDARTGASTGPAQRVSMTNGDNPSFSPDGKFIAFMSAGANLSAATLNPLHRKRDLVVVPSTGGAERILATYDQSFTPTWSADGQSLFVHLAGGQGKQEAFERIAVDGGPRQPASTFTHQGSSIGLIDGRIALYTQNSGGFDEGRFTYESASGTLGEVVLLPRMGVNSIQAKRAIGITTTSTNTLQILNLDDGKLHPLAVQGSDARDARWSPDGKRLVFLTGSGKQTELVMVNADGSGSRHFPFAGLGSSVLWSPDGASVLYASGDRRQIQLLNVTTGATRVITSVSEPSSFGVPVVWQPDGKSFLANVGAASTNAIVEYRLDGTRREVRNLSAEFPSAIQVYLTSNRQAVVEVGESLLAGPKQVVVVPLDGSAAQPVPMPALDSSLRLTPAAPSFRNDKWLFSNIIMRFRVVGIQAMSTGGDSTRVIRFPSNQIFLQPTFLLPDGKNVMKIGGVASARSNYQLYSIPLDGTASRVVGHIPRPALGTEGGLSISGLAGGLSRDGKRFAFFAKGQPITHVYDIDFTPIVQTAGKR